MRFVHGQLLAQCFIVMAILTSPLRMSRAATFTTLNLPNSDNIVAAAVGFFGSSVAGRYTDVKSHGFIYDGSVTTTLNDPLAGSQIGTVVNGSSGDRIVGYYVDPASKTHGFVYDGVAYKTLDDPLGTNGTQVTGVSGNTYVGAYFTDTTSGSFVFDGTTWTDFKLPGNSAVPVISGISGNLIYGHYQDNANVEQGFVFNGSSYVTYHDPLAPFVTEVTGVSGNNVVGFYWDQSNIIHGFIFDGVTYQTIDDPLATRETRILGISGNTIAGYYLDERTYYAFTAVVPEPASFLLLGIGTIGLAFAARWRRQQ